MVLPERSEGPAADQDTDEEPIEDAKIEEQEEEGDFLEDFPDDTDVGVSHQLTRVPDNNNTEALLFCLDRISSSSILELDRLPVSGFRDSQII